MKGSQIINQLVIELIKQLQFQLIINQLIFSKLSDWTIFLIINCDCDHNYPEFAIRSSKCDIISSITWEIRKLLILNCKLIIMLIDYKPLNNSFDWIQMPHKCKTIDD